MAETSIGWTATWSEKHQRFFDGYTFNGWWGCTKVDEECANCYAETFDHRLGGAHWGKGRPRRQFNDAHWLQPYKWARKARELGVRLKVFCASMSDLFDVDAPPGALERLWRVIEGTPELDWLLLTKRPLRARELLPWMAGRRARAARRFEERRRGRLREAARRSAGRMRRRRRSARAPARQQARGREGMARRFTRSRMAAGGLRCGAWGCGSFGCCSPRWRSRPSCAPGARAGASA